MLTATQISFERHFQRVFQPLDIQLAGGQVNMISGANGCGKTTLIRILAGILTPSRGTLLNESHGTAYIGHTLAVKDDLSVTENLRFVSRFLGTGDLELGQVLNRLGLNRVATQAARTLSAGQRKRCALARLLLAPAQLWLLDEPYSNLDDEGIALVDGLLLEHAQQGGGCILASHGNHQPDIQGLSVTRLSSAASLP